MPTIQFQLDVDVISMLQSKYTELHYPLGKSRRGRKKWIKRYIVKALTELAYKNATT